jgi:hypothetical protein
MNKVTVAFNLLVVVNISEKPFNLLSVPDVYKNVVLQVRWVHLVC